MTLVPTTVARPSGHGWCSTGDHERLLARRSRHGIGDCAHRVGLGAVMGVVWWLVTPTEQWIKVDGGLGAAQISSPNWFAADGWFLVIGVLAGLVLAGVSWIWARRNPITLVVGLLIGAALLSSVAWSVGGSSDHPTPTSPRLPLRSVRPG